MKYKISKSEVKVAIGLLVMCIIILVLILLFGNLNSKNNVNVNNINYKEDMSIIQDYDRFFFVKDNINKYLSYISSQDSEAVYDLSDEYYLKNNGIDVHNILSKIQLDGDDLSFYCEKVYERNVNDNYIYYAIGDVVQNKMDFKETVRDDFSIVLLVDYNNFTISFIPVLSDNEVNEILYKKQSINISKNLYNEMVKIGNVSINTICSLYYTMFLDSTYEDINYSYSLLSTEMKSNFIDINEYNDFITDKRSKFSYSIEKCGIDTSKENNEFHLYDKNGNYFILNEYSIMNYDVYFELNESQE